MNACQNGIKAMMRTRLHLVLKEDEPAEHNEAPYFGLKAESEAHNAAAKYGNDSKDTIKDHKEF